uniref:Cytochrome P450 94A2 n=1 Tax=Vicia sativa TaxID=3908 RepID=C94A2_VICSA|nr:RecName: Full=Cytochrome P450 94A2; AltName: Full=P450-dependent fatty acid omega-hydroxylase [Vicia sativa]AAG33645.1 cytochrome P450-dependent fatty acid hydroxylase [Vicia sativa]
MELETLISWLLFSTSLFWFLFLATKTKSKPPKTPSSTTNTPIPKSYPIFGSAFSLLANFHRRIQWTSDILQTIPSSTFVLHRPFGARQVFTAQPAVVQHILRTNFTCYGKGLTFYQSINDFLGDGIFNADGESWKFQRQISSHEFNTRSLRKFVETVVDVELSDRLVPVLSQASNSQTTLDFQDILQRLTFDNICMIAFGYDPEYLLPSLPEIPFAKAFDESSQLSIERLNALIPLLWKVKRFLNIGVERQLKEAVAEVRGLATKIVKNKKKELKEKALQSESESVDLLSRFLSSGHSDESFVTDMVISIILAGRDTTSAALTWFFWLLSKHSHVENEILKEITGKSETVGYDEVKDMVYTHAALCESMRLYPPLPVDTKVAVHDDVLPDGTLVKKGWRVTYHIYAMGRSEKIWGPDWAEFRPERWLSRDEVGKWSFVGIDYYSYPVFQAGPRVCIGKEMAFLQMKRVVAGIMGRFRVVPAMVEGIEPEYTAHFTSVMKGGFPVKIEKRSPLV